MILSIYIYNAGNAGSKQIDEFDAGKEKRERAKKGLNQKAKFASKTTIMQNNFKQWLETGGNSPLGGIM